MFYFKEILLLFFSVLIYSSAVTADSLSKNHKKAIAYDCKYNLNNDFDSINECKNLLVVALKRDGVLFNLSNFKSKKINKAERACSKRIQQGVYKYNACLAEMLDVNVEIEEPPIVVANNEQEEESDDSNNDNQEDSTQNNKRPAETNNDIILTANDIYNKVVKSSFQVWASSVDDKWEVCGSSVVIDRNKLATNCHVVLKNENQPHKSIAVINHKDDAKDINKWNEAKVIAKDPKNDICIIESLTVIAPPVKIKKYEQIEMLEKAYVVGGPQCQPGVMTSGEIQNKYDFGYGLQLKDGWQEFTVPILQTNAHIRGGNSGGGLFDKNANLIGITTIGEMSDSPNPFNLAISADNFIKLLNKQ